MTLTKANLIVDVAKIGYTKIQASRMLETLFETMKKSLEHGDKVLISGFGKFSVKNNKRFAEGEARAEQGLPGAEKRTVRFKCSKVLRNKMNG